MKFDNTGAIRWLMSKLAEALSKFWVQIVVFVTFMAVLAVAIVGKSAVGGTWVLVIFAKSYARYTIQMVNRPSAY